MLDSTYRLSCRTIKCSISLVYFYFAKAYWGKGYAAEASRACIKHAKDNLNINKIIASVDPSHSTSQRVLEKLGFQYKGMKWFEETKQEDLYYELLLGDGQD